VCNNFRLGRCVRGGACPYSHDAQGEHCRSLILTGAVQTGSLAAVQTGSLAAVQTGSLAAVQTGSLAAVQTGSLAAVQTGGLAAVQTGSLAAPVILLLPCYHIRWLLVDACGLALAPLWCVAVLCVPCRSLLGGGD